jgi:hypothetical protein
MPSIPFKSMKAIKALSVGDKFSGDSGMGGSFTYTVERRKDRGLELSSSSDASWEKTQLHSWEQIKSGFFVNASSPLYQVNQSQFDAAQKAGYSKPEDVAKALKCTLAEVERGASAPVDIYRIQNKDGSHIDFANIHDATYIARQLIVPPPEKQSVSMQQYLTGPTYQSVSEYLIESEAKNVLEYYPDFTIEQQRRALKDKLDPFIKFPNAAILDINESSREKRDLANTFGQVVDKPLLSSVIRGTEILNDLKSYTHEHGQVDKAPHNKNVTLLVNGKATEFIHQEVHNQQFVLYNEELGMTSPDMTSDLNAIIKPVLDQMGKKPRPPSETDEPSLENTKLSR